VITADAPGKLVVLGEYAVLTGAPGIAVAVDARARARITPVAEALSVLTIPETGARHPFRWISGGAPRWEGPSPGAFGLPLESVTEILHARGHLRRAGDLPATAIALSTADFHTTDARGQRHKLGLGSSAAIVVALTGALLRHAGAAGVDQAEQLAIACEAHRRLQGGAGSGTDVATSLYGGVVGVEFQASGGVPRVTPLAWPQDLHCLAIWTGRSASTPAMLARLRGWQQAQPVTWPGSAPRPRGASRPGGRATRPACWPPSATSPPDCASSTTPSASASGRPSTGTSRRSPPRPAWPTSPPGPAAVTTDSPSPRGRQRSRPCGRRSRRRGSSASGRRSRRRACWCMARPPTGGRWRAGPADAGAQPR
jgi:mevalonate kinase